MAVRQQEFDAAFKDVDQARSLVPSDSRIEALLGLIESRRGKLPEAIAHLKKAVEFDPNNLKALYALAEETEREATPTSDSDAEKLFARVLEKRSRNISVLLEVARLAAKTGDAGPLKNAVQKLTEASASWPDEAKQQMGLLEQAAAGSNVRGAALRKLVFLRNTLARVPEYRKNLNEVKTPSTFVSDPFLTFLRLPVPSSQTAPG